MGFFKSLKEDILDDASDLSKAGTCYDEQINMDYSMEEYNAFLTGRLGMTKDTARLFGESFMEEITDRIEDEMVVALARWGDNSLRAHGYREGMERIVTLLQSEMNELRKTIREI